MWEPFAMPFAPRLLERTQTFGRPILQVFDFFSRAENLEAITPPWVNFRILTPTPIDMHEGTIIDYRLRIKGVPIRWRTRILIWDPPYRFVDTQLRGPYALWRHTHTFEPTGVGETRMTDQVEYIPKGGPLEPLVTALFVRGDIERIFDYRYEALEREFGGV